MLRIDGLEAGYEDSQVLFGLGLEIGAGEVVTLLGRNGMGKTTTVRTIMGIVRAQAGTILLDGQPIQELPSFKIARLVGFPLTLIEPKAASHRTSHPALLFMTSKWCLGPAGTRTSTKSPVPKSAAGASES